VKLRIGEKALPGIAFFREMPDKRPAGRTSERLISTSMGINTLIGMGAVTSDFDRIYCIRCQFAKFSVPKASFDNAFLDEADFRFAVLPGANFSDASLIETSFRGASLAGAKFNGANALVQFWFHSAADRPSSLTDFSCSDLTGAFFSEAVVAGVSEEDQSDWKNAQSNFSGAVLENADLSDVKFFIATKTGHSNAFDYFKHTLSPSDVIFEIKAPSGSSWRIASEVDVPAGDKSDERYIQRAVEASIGGAKSYKGAKLDAGLEPGPVFLGPPCN
jgi:hypothetical protein